MRKFDAYVRVSRTMGREGDRFHSPDMQRQAIEGWAAREGIEIAEWHTDLDVSGGKMQRPGLDALMARVERGHTEGLAVAKLDRLARTVTGGLETIATIDRLGAEFVAVHDGVDRSTPTGRMMFGFLLLLAEWHLEVTREGWDETVRRVVERGGFAGTTPFGYLKGAGAVLERDPDEAPYLLGAFERRANGDTWQSVADWLNAEDVRPRRATRWTRDTVRDICRHELYLGVSAKQGHRNEAAHEPLVTRALWERVQNVPRVQPTATKSDGNLLAGLLRCAGCSFTMAGSSYKPAGKEPVRQYVCKRHHGTGTCPEPASINASVIEPFAEGAFLDLVGKLALAPSVNAPELAAAEAELQDAIAAEIAWAEKFSEGFSPAAYEAGTRKVTDRVRAASEAVEAARRAATGINLPSAVELQGIWPTLSKGEKRRLMAAGVDYLAVSKGRRPVAERVRVVALGEGPKGLPRKGVSAPIRAL